MERLSIGAFGLNELLGGGLPKNTVTLVVGGVGSGKTVLGLQYLFENALKNNRTLFAGFNESPKELMEVSTSFGWNFSTLEKQNKTVFFDCASARAGVYPGKKGLKPGEDVVGAILREAISMNAKCLVIDSFSALSSKEDTRKYFHSLSRKIKSSGLTALIVTEPNCAPVNEADNVIELIQKQDEAFLKVSKVRGSSHSRHSHPYKITESGFYVQRADFVF